LGKDSPQRHRGHREERREEFTAEDAEERREEELKAGVDGI